FYIFQIAFKNYSVEDCKKTWAIIQKKVRRFRLLKEVLEDAGKLVSETKFKKTKAKKNRHPDMPRRPLSVYFIYYLTRREAVQAENPGIEATEVGKLCSQEFKSLPPEKKEKYEKAAQKNKEEYELKMEEFYQLHPEEKLVKANKAKPEKAKSPKSAKEKPVPKLPKEKPLPKSPKEKLPPKAKAPKKSLPPFQYYLISEMEKENVEDKNSFKEVCKERWKNMSDDAKMEWISYAEAENFKYEEEMKEFLRDHPEHVVQSTQKSFLTKKEQLVKERASGRPAKPPVSSYNIFARTMLQTEKIKEVPARDRMIYVSNQWKHCSEEDKKHYKDLYDKLTQQYKNDYAAFLETLSVEERELELKKMPRKKSEEEKAKKGPKVKKTPVKRAAGKGAGPSEKKVAKKAPPRKLVEPEQPPISPFKYFVTTYKGEEPAIKAWKALPQDERKQFEVELIKKKQMYIQEFEKFLKSMTKEELEEFSKARSKVKQEQQENEDEESSDESDTDDSDEESDEED
ncbi:Nucleolar transcription factor 1, partial [Gonioctena quinquepunctata]